MRDLLYSILVSIIITFISHSCANPGMITGGPKDTIPPILIQSIPENGSTNYHGREFTFEFDERINADQLKSKLLITPYIDNPFKHTVKKNILTIKFDKDFEDSTTYIFNFADGVGDLNEKNSVVNFRLAFSTTSFIDSLHISGKILKLTENQPAKKYIVSLYSSDTASVLKHKPLYFTYTDENGNFLLENLKATKYRIYAFEDENKNLVLDPKKEPFGFLQDTIFLKENLDSLKINTFLIDASPLTLIRKGMSAQYYEIKFSKLIKEYYLSPLDSTKSTPPSSLFDDNTSIRFYNESTNTKDSVGYYLIAKDSLANEIIDTVYIKFQPGTRKPAEFKLSTTTKDKAIVLDSIRFNLDAYKPLRPIDIDTIIISTAKKNIPYKLNELGYYLVDNQYNRLNFSIVKLSQFLQNWRDSLISQIRLDSVNYTDAQRYSDTLKTFQQMPTDNYTISIAKGKIISIENDTAAVFKVSFMEPNPEQYGTVSGSINTDKKHFTLELINKSGKTIKSITNPENQYKFTLVSQGTYSIRVLIPNEGRTSWSYGNLLKNQQHDSVHYHPAQFDVRPNWEVEKIDLTF